MAENISLLWTGEITEEMIVAAEVAERAYLQEQQANDEFTLTQLAGDFISLEDILIEPDEYPKTHDKSEVMTEEEEEVEISDEHENISLIIASCEGASTMSDFSLDSIFPASQYEPGPPVIDLVSSDDE